MIENYQLKNYFSTITANFQSFPDVDEDMYYWVYSNKIDGKTYTCMRHCDEVKIFDGHIHENLYYSVEPKMTFEL